MKIRNTIAVMICIMLLASCCIVAAAASGSENVGGGFWAWETIPGFMAKSSYLHRLQRHSAWLKAQAKSFATLLMQIKQL